MSKMSSSRPRRGKKRMRLTGTAVLKSMTTEFFQPSPVTPATILPPLKMPWPGVKRRKWAVVKSPSNCFFTARIWSSRAEQPSVVWIWPPVYGSSVLMSAALGSIRVRLTAGSMKRGPMALSAKSMRVSAAAPWGVTPTGSVPTSWPSASNSQYSPAPSSDSRLGQGLPSSPPTRNSPRLCAGTIDRTSRKHEAMMYCMTFLP